MHLSVSHFCSLCILCCSVTLDMLFELIQFFLKGLFTLSPADLFPIELMSSPAAYHVAAVSVMYIHVHTTNKLNCTINGNKQS